MIRVARGDGRHTWRVSSDIRSGPPGLCVMCRITWILGPVNMTRKIVSGEDDKELKRLYEQHALAAMRASVLLAKEGMESRRFREADKAAGKAWRRIKDDIWRFELILDVNPLGCPTTPHWRERRFHVSRRGSLSAIRIMASAAGLPKIDNCCPKCFPRAKIETLASG